MSPPIFTPDGSEVSEIVLPDGSTASEVIGPDGNVVFEAGGDIPDSEKLHARYDARELSLSDGDTVSTWSDQVAGADLSAVGAPIYNQNGINGVPAVGYDGVDDRHDATFASSISDPYSIFFSGRLRSNGPAQHAYSDNPVPSNGFVGFQIDDSNGNYNWKINGGTPDPNLGTTDTSAHIFSSLFNSGTGDLRVDSSNTGSGVSESDLNDFEGISLGSRPDESGPADILITEVLVYSVDESSNVSEIENYLDRDLGLI